MYQQVYNELSSTFLATCGLYPNDGTCKIIVAMRVARKTSCFLWSHLCTKCKRWGNSEIIIACSQYDLVCLFLPCIFIHHALMPKRQVSTFPIGYSGLLPWMIQTSLSQTKLFFFLIRLKNYSMSQSCRARLFCIVRLIQPNSSFHFSSFLWAWLSKYTRKDMTDKIKHIGQQEKIWRTR